jgi:hypothetical protein
MKASLAKRIERNADLAASAVFAASVGYAAFIALQPSVAQPALGAIAVAIAAVAYWLCLRALGALEPRVQFPVPIFDVRTIDPPATGEPAATAVDGVGPDAAEEPLVLDDILAELDPEARVVRLFDRSAMPTPGQLKERIDGHLDQAASPASIPDASQALSDALAELRRSLG